MIFSCFVVSHRRSYNFAFVRLCSSLGAISSYVPYHYFRQLYSFLRSFASSGTPGSSSQNNRGMTRIRCNPTERVEQSVVCGEGLHQFVDHWTNEGSHYRTEDDGEGQVSWKEVEEMDDRYLNSRKLRVTRYWHGSGPLIKDLMDHASYIHRGHHSILGDSCRPCVADQSAGRT